MPVQQRFGGLIWLRIFRGSDLVFTVKLLRAGAIVQGYRGPRPAVQVLAYRVTETMELTSLNLLKAREAVSVAQILAFADLLLLMALQGRHLRPAIFLIAQPPCLPMLLCMMVLIIKYMAPE